MATSSIADSIESTAQICQGDIFQDVKYSYISKDSDDTIEVIEYTFPRAIVISQACDVDFMSKMVDNNSGKVNKFMPSILMCPIYDKDEAKEKSHIDEAFAELNIKKEEDSNPLFSSKEFDVVERDWHYRYHSLKVFDTNKRIILENVILDFKHYFTVPVTYLLENRNKRVCHLNSLFAEQITLKFATYLSRVAIP